MKTVNFATLNEKIEQKRKEANRQIIKNRVGRGYRTRTRSEDERTILDLLSKKRWEKAVEKGKVKYISEREIYYDFD